MKKLLIALMFSIAACSSCAHENVFSPHSTPWRSTDDPEAAYAQELMKHAVRISEEIDVELTEDMLNDVTLAEPYKETLRYSGSGVVVENSLNGKGGSLVMTAGHMCAPPKMGLQIFMGKDGNIRAGVPVIKAIRHKVISLDGRTLDTQILYYSYDDEDNTTPDICGMQTEGRAGDAVELAEQMPPEGAMVQNVGYPLGWQEKWVAHIADGRYEGLSDGWYKEAMLSVPSVGGLSGSGIYYRGKLFAILVKGARRFEHITIGTALPALRRAKFKAEAKWQNQ